jgi:hypothetical protein
MGMLKITAVAAVLVVLQLLAACDGRKEDMATVEAMRLLGRPVVCGGSSDDGFVCFDAVGHAVWCPKAKTKPCEQIPAMATPGCPELAR